MMPVNQALTVKVGIEEFETVYAGWRWRWKYWSGSRAADGHTHEAFMDLPFVTAFEETDYKPPRLS